MIERDRWRLRRRALVLLAAAYPLHWFWSGEILHFFAVYFVVASFAITWRIRTLLAAAVAATLGALVLEAAVRHHHLFVWLAEADIHRPRQLLGDVLASGTHPIFPWLAFVFVGMVLGRRDLMQPGLGERLLLGGAAAWVIAHLARNIGTDAFPLRFRWLASIDLYNPMPLFVLSAGGFALGLLGACLVVARRTRSGRLSRALSVTGQQTFSLYYLHAVVAVVAGRYAGARDLTVAQAVGAAVLYWVVAIAASNFYSAHWGLGPAERLLRRIGD